MLGRIYRTDRPLFAGPTTIRKFGPGPFFISLPQFTFPPEKVGKTVRVLLYSVDGTKLLETHCEALIEAGVNRVRFRQKTFQEPLPKLKGTTIFAVVYPTSEWNPLADELPEPILKKEAEVMPPIVP